MNSFEKDLKEFQTNVIFVGGFAYSGGRCIGSYKLMQWKVIDPEKGWAGDIEKITVKFDLTINPNYLTD